MNILVSELFDKVEKAVSQQDKVKLLLQYNEAVVRGLFVLNFHPNYNMNLPEGTPPFKREADKPIGYQHTTLFSEFKRFYIWMDPNINITRIKKESLFIEMLEGLHYTEADIICAAKDGKLESIYPSITEDLVRLAHPTLLNFPPTVKEEIKPKKSRSKKSLVSL